ncbi:MAG: TRIC cation channel family protein [Caulobacteraceae bacterium]|nr:TRIC cation channel family protein [Caulobacteraceae bacterium]
MTPRSSRLIFVLDLAGTFVFALQGAGRAMDARLDLLGVLVISFAASLGGGILRDLLIDAAPPQALRDWRYPATAFAAGVAALLFHEVVHRIPGALLTGLDAAGLALFAIAGAQKALGYGLNALAAILMGGVTAVGGGVARDLLLNQAPSVLYADIYATAALAGALVMVAGRRLGLANGWAAGLGGLACFALRIAAVWFHWNLPSAA